MAKVFVDGDGFHGVLHIPDPVEKACEDCGAIHTNRYKCDDCLIAQAVADGLLTAPKEEGS